MTKNLKKNYGIAKEIKSIIDFLNSRNNLYDEEVIEKIATVGDLIKAVENASGNI